MSELANFTNEEAHQIADMAAEITEKCFSILETEVAALDMSHAAKVETLLEVASTMVVVGLVQNFTLDTAEAIDEMVQLVEGNVKSKLMVVKENHLQVPA